MVATLITPLRSSHACLEPDPESSPMMANSGDRKRMRDSWQILGDAEAGLKKSTETSKQPESGLEAIEIVMKSMGVDIDHDDLEKGFFQYGLDSLELVRVKDRLGEELKVTLSSTLLMDYPSINDLREHLDETIFAARHTRKGPPAESKDAAKSADQARAFKTGLEVIEFVMKEVGLEDGIDEDDLDKGFFQYGLDSLDLVRVKDLLSEELNEKLPSTLLMDFPSIKDLSEHLDENFFAEQSATPQAGDPADTACNTVQQVKRVQTGIEVIQTVMTSMGSDVDLDDLDKGFFQYGLDSLDLVTMKDKLSEKLQLEMPATLLMDYPTVKDLEEYLDAEVIVSGSPQETEQPDESALAPVSNDHGESMQVLVKLVNELLGQDARRKAYEENAGFVQVGLNSTKLHQLRRRLEVWSGCALPVTLLFDHPTFASLSKCLDEVREGRRDVGLCSRGDKTKRASFEDFGGRRTRVPMWERIYKHADSSPPTCQGRRTASDPVGLSQGGSAKVRLQTKTKTQFPLDNSVVDRSIQKRWNAMSAAELCDLQESLVDMYSRPDAQRKFAQVAKDCGMDQVKHCLVLDDVMRSFQGPILVENGLAKSLLPADVHMGRVWMQQRIMALWNKEPELQRISEHLLELVGLSAML